MNTIYPSDLTDTEREYLRHYLRESRSTCRKFASLPSVAYLAIACVVVGRVNPRVLVSSAFPPSLSCGRISVEYASERTETL
jgi:hypothetical protein